MKYFFSQNDFYLLTYYSGNIYYYTWTSLPASSSNHNTVNDNTANDNEHFGIEVHDSSDNEIKYNTFNSNGRFGNM